MSIQGQTLEVTVAGCIKLKNTKWISTQKPYVSIEYGGSKFLSSICKDGGTNPTFQEKNRITLVEGLKELNVSVWSSNSMTYDNLIGSGSVQLQKVLSEGFDDTPWTIKSKTNRYAGEVCLVMHYSNANKHAPQCCAVPHPPQQVCLYYAAAPPQPSMYHMLKNTLKHTIKQLPYSLHVPQASYPPQPYPPHGYSPNPHQAYPPQN